MRIFSCVLASAALLTVCTMQTMAVLVPPKGMDIEKWLQSWNSNATPLRFDGDQVWSLSVQSEAQLEMLNIIAETFALDFWTPLRIGQVDVRIPSSLQTGFKILFSPFEYSVRIDDVQGLIDLQAEAAGPALDSDQIVLDPSSTHDSVKSWFKQYHTYDEILKHIHELQDKHPHLIQSFTVGQTFEGRDIHGFKVHNNASSAHPVRDIVFHGGHHAREWIGPAVVVYMLTELVEKYSHDERITALVDTFRFHIIPVLNVDGFVYTHTHNRMWRKNRQPNNLFCIGTDPNRNWGYKWGEKGSSTNPCREDYQGPFAFSAPESKNMANYLAQLAPNVVSYIDWHAFGQMWMYPYGADCDRSVEPVIGEAAQAAAKALKSVHGTKYAVGSICNVIYVASGSSIDWAYTSANVTFAYGVELRDTGKHGFLLPPDQIIPTAEETFEGALTLYEFIAKHEKQQL
ncbi:uncharacterized protein BJ171DRAFT_439658 [Polychytrium aggregatum]|uniref:uncharacterized protein n=1 Tax=Polychytrium aggregatum TaxID=110093 RepID=UPI0022FEE2DB|nr:uncharacterized protein BJ171DRAFT_439658 [Polychytrium aggregatum]KAI9207380.1 hypothetical protein BJ171DRAFT_439658 [Polychytrium aggregatum]